MVRIGRMKFVYLISDSYIRGTNCEKHNKVEQKPCEFFSRGFLYLENIYGL